MHSHPIPGVPGAPAPGHAAPRALRALTWATAVALLGGCMLGPDHVRPPLDAPATFARAAEPARVDAVAPQPVPRDLEFWTAFGDPLLVRLVDEALLANHDLRIALARYDRARALLRGQRFDRLPTVTAEAEAADVRASADQAPGLSRADRDGERHAASAALGWEIDVFGRVRRAVEAAGAEAAASAAELDAVQVAIVGEVASGYVQLRGLQERLRVARENAAVQARTLELVQTRYDAGMGTEFDTARARAQLAVTEARIPALEAQAAQAMHRLAVLTGRTPDALLATLAEAAPLPPLPPTPDPGAPGELLRRRPDVAAAEHRLHAATARIGVAKADLFPRFTLGALIGSQALDAGALFERDSEQRAVALGIDWSFLDFGRVRTRIAASDAQASEALARYQQAVLHALEDTENALVAYARARQEDDHLQRAAADSQRAAELARTRYDAGAADLLEVLDAERTRLQAEDARADARTRSVLGAVGLYRALAGGWPARTPLREGVAGR